MSESAPLQQPSPIQSLGVDSYTISRLQHATPEHLHITSRRCFIGPVPEGWLKSHRRDWYKRHLHIHYSSRAATFSADPRVGKHRRLTGLEGPSARATLSFPQPQGLGEAEEEAIEEAIVEDEEEDVTATTDVPPALKVPRSVQSDPEEEVKTEETQTSDDKAPSRTDQSNTTADKQSSADHDPRSEHKLHGDQAKIPDESDTDDQLHEITPVATTELPYHERRHRNGSQKESSGSYVTADESARSKRSMRSSDQLRAIDESSSDEASLRTARDTQGHSDSSNPSANDSTNDRNSRSSLLGHSQYDGVKKDSIEEQTKSDPQPSRISRAATVIRNRGASTHENVTIQDGQINRAGTTGLVRFNLPEDDASKQRQVNLRLAQMRKRDTLTRIHKGKIRDGQIVKMENMLVRVETTAHEILADFDENDSQKIESTTLAKWKEYMVVCRESTNDDAPFVLQMYKTRVITAADRSNKRCVYRITLNKSDCRINLFSSLDKTIVLWCSGKKKGTKIIYIFQAKSSASSMEWYTFIRNVLGWARPSSLQINVPDLEVNVRIQNPFAAIESSRDIAQAAQGDDNALFRTMKEEQAVAAKVIKRCTETLKKTQEFSDVLDYWSKRQLIGLAWKRYDRLEWVHGANEDKMYGTIGMEKSHDLELRPKEHYPTIIATNDNGHILEPPPVEGFLIRLTSQRGVNKKLGKLFFKRLYFSTHDHFLVFNRPARADPPPPPKLPMQHDSRIPSVHQIADKIPLIYSINPYPLKNGQVEWLSKNSRKSQQDLHHHDHDAFDESERKINNVLSCDGVINMCNIVKVRDVYRGAAMADENIEENIDVDFNQNVANTDRDDGTTTGFDDSRTFELLLQNRLVVRLQAYDRTTKKEWMERLRALIVYWKKRKAADITLLKSVRKQNLLKLNIDEETEALVGQYARKWEVRSAFASPELYNMCGISCCRSIHISGLLWRRPRMHGTFRRNLVVLSHGHLVYFQDALRRRDGKLIAHIHHERVGGLDLRHCYVYSGLITEKDLLYRGRNFDSKHPGHHALPRMYLEDGWNSTDEDTMTTFVVWHGRRHGWFKSLQADTEGHGKRKKLQHVQQLGAEGRSVVFKTRSRAERDRWVLAIGMEIERLAQGDEVRIVDGG